MQDFASYRNTLDPVASEAYDTDWSPDIPSLVLGVLIGFFVAIMGFNLVEYRAGQAVLVEVEVPVVVEDVVKKPFVFEFYDELKSYVVLPRG
jgi:hypothetical protein